MHTSTSIPACISTCIPGVAIYDSSMLAFIPAFTHRCQPPESLEPFIQTIDVHTCCHRQLSRTFRLQHACAFAFSVHAPFDLRSTSYHCSKLCISVTRLRPSAVDGDVMFSRMACHRHPIKIRTRAYVFAISTPGPYRPPTYTSLCVTSSQMLCHAIACHILPWSRMLTQLEHLSLQCRTLHHRTLPSPWHDLIALRAILSCKSLRSLCAPSIPCLS